MNEILDKEDLVRELYRDPVMLAQIQNRIIRRRIHSQILTLIAEALESGRIKLEDIKETDTLIAIESLLAKM